VPTSALAIEAGGGAVLTNPAFQLDPDAWYIYMARAGNGGPGKYWVRKMGVETYTGALNTHDGDLDGLRLWNRYAPFDSNYRGCCEWKASAVFSGVNTDEEAEAILDRIEATFTGLLTPKA